MMKLIIEVVEPQDIWKVWEEVVPHIQRVVGASKGEVSMHSTLAKLATGTDLLVVIRDPSDSDEIVACNVLSTRTTESGVKLLYIRVTAGTRLVEWLQDFLALSKELAKKFNCTELRGMSVREGWMEVLAKEGWEEVYTEIKCKIEEDA